MSTNTPNMPHWTEPAPADFQGIPEGNYQKPVIDAPKVGEVAAKHVEVQQVGGAQDVDVNHQLPAEATK